MLQLIVRGSPFEMGHFWDFFARYAVAAGVVPNNVKHLIKRVAKIN